VIGLLKQENRDRAEIIINEYGRTIYDKNGNLKQLWEILEMLSELWEELEDE